MPLYTLPKISNIVCVWSLSRNVTIQGKSGKGTKRFNADVVKENKKTLLVFESGMITSTGFITIKAAKSFVQKIFPDDKIKLIRVSNIMAKGRIKCYIDVDGFVNAHQHVSYEPEIFPAIYWKDNKICVTYFPKGTYIITGVTNRKQMKEVFLKFFNQLKFAIKAR